MEVVEVLVVLFVLPTSTDWVSPLCLRCNHRLHPFGNVVVSHQEEPEAHLVVLDRSEHQWSQLRSRNGRVCCGTCPVAIRIVVASVVRKADDAEADPEVEPEADEAARAVHPVVAAEVEVVWR